MESIEDIASRIAGEGHYSREEVLASADVARHVYHSSLLPYRLSLGVAFFKTFAIPAISGVLVPGIAKADERVRRTLSGIDALIEAPEECKGHVIEGINKAHRGVGSSGAPSHGPMNHAMVYVLSLFAVEPVRWFDRYSENPLSRPEKDATYLLWRTIGERMGISGIPQTYESLEKFHDAYEAEHMKFSPVNKRVADAMMGTYCMHMLPFLLENRCEEEPLAQRLLGTLGGERGPIKRAVKTITNLGFKACAISLMDDRMRHALGYRAARAPLKHAVEGYMRRLSA